MTISEALIGYKKNMAEAESLTDALFTKDNKEEWIKALEHRAERLSILYQEDNDLINFIYKEIENIKDEEIDDIFESLFDLYNDGYDDSYVLIPILNKLEEYYRKNNNYEKLVVSCSIHSYESHEYVSRIDPTVPLDIGLYKEVLNLRSHYGEIENPRRRANFFVG